MRDMATSNTWMMQLLAMLAAQELPAEQEKALVQKVAQATQDATVKKFAVARLEALKIAATRPATTEPIRAPLATQPIARLGPELTPPPTPESPATRPSGAINVPSLEAK